MLVPLLDTNPGVRKRRGEPGGPKRPPTSSSKPELHLAQTLVTDWLTIGRASRPLRVTGDYDDEHTDRYRAQSGAVRQVDAPAVVGDLTAIARSTPTTTG